MNITYLIITGICMLASRFAGHMLSKRFREFSTLPIQLTGRQIAEKMLADHDLQNVQVIATPGQLTDHYNPRNQTVNLSDVVDRPANIAAAAVAAHECGHAIQHATSYGMLKLRSNLVPLVNLSSKYMQWVLMAGIALAASGNPILLYVGIAMFGMTTLFAVVTLPVEFNATARAIKWLETSGVAPEGYHDEARSALRWAAMTYVVAALASLGQLLYYIRMIAARR